MRIGIAGMAERPAVLRMETNDASAMTDSIERLAREIEGYDDLQASARMRRDVLRRLAPLVVQETMRCAA